MLKELKKSDIINQQLIEDHRTNGLRSGEGAVVSLRDGSLLMVYGRFGGLADHDSAALVERRSDDGGNTWSKANAFMKAPKGALNVMSVSLLRLRNGQLAAVYLVKYSPATDCRPVFVISDDEGKSWGEPIAITSEPGYYIVNNDRLVQLASGRILVPFGKAIDSPANQACGCFISDDHGQTWHTGQTIRIERENILEPESSQTLETINGGLWRSPTGLFDINKVYAQEPGVVELLNGRVCMWTRSTGGYAYKALCEDGGESWSDFKAIKEFSVPSGPQSIKRLPDSNRLIMLYNDRGDMPFDAPQFQWRRPLSIAISDDDTKTWQRYGQLEPDDIPSNCYYNICFDNGNVLFTYYEGVMQTQRDGSFAPRNLASLKLKIVKQRYFEKGL